MADGIVVEDDISWAYGRQIGSCIKINDDEGVGIGVVQVVDGSWHANSISLQKSLGVRFASKELAIEAIRKKEDALQRSKNLARGRKNKNK